MGRSLDYDEANEILKDHFEEAEEDFRKEEIVEVNKAARSAAKLLFASSTQAFREALIGCALARILDRKIDIRKPYMNQGDDAFNGRTLDERVVNPFLHEKEIPCSKGPYLSALRRNISLVPDTAKGIRDKDAYMAMLSFIDVLEASTQLEAQSLLLYLLSMFIELREGAKVTLSKINRLSVEQYAHLLGGLLGTKSGGLMPVLLAVATFTAIKTVYGLPWEIQWQGINVADAASGTGGDITISRGKETVLSVEVTERTIDADRVRSTFRTKISTTAIDDYLFFYSGSPPTDDARNRARAYFAQGHEINFASVKDWIMTVLSTLGAKGRTKFTDEIINLLDRTEVPAALEVAWNAHVRAIVAA